MPIDDVDTPGEPGWWFRTLSTDLMDRRPRLQALWDRYRGDPPLPELGSPGANDARKKVWKAFQRKARTNYEALIIGCVLDRLTPIGFRLLDDERPSAIARARSGGIPTDALVDAAARRVWAGNDMPTAIGDLLEKFLVMGDAYALVGAPSPDQRDLPIVTEEDPRWTITAQDPVRPSRELAGLKMFFDDIARRDVAYLYLPGRVIRAERQGREGVSELALKRWRFNPEQWDVVLDTPLPASLGQRLPIVRFANRGGVGEFEDHVDHLDRINHMLLQRIVIATLQAFRQRAIKGVPRTDPKTGAKIDYNDVFTADPGALWLLPATAEMWESGQVDLTPILSSVKDDVRDLAAVLRLPIQSFLPDSANQSAEGAAASREGLVFRVEDRQVRASSGLARVMALAFAYLDDSERSDPLRIETLWRSIERWSLNERAQAAVAAKAAGVPWEALMTDWLGYEPDQLPLLRRQRAEDALLAPAQPGEPTRGLPAGSGSGTGARAQLTSGADPAAAPTSAGQSGPAERGAA